MEQKVILFSKYSRKGASSRLRSYQYLIGLENASVKIEVNSLFSDEYLNKLYKKEAVSPMYFLRRIFLRLNTIAKIRKCDVVWIEKELFPWIPFIDLILLKLMNVPYVLDYDDAIFHKYDQHRFFLIRVLLGKKLKNLMKHASAVMVGNAYLRKYALDSGASKVVVIPTVVDLDRYHVKSNVDDGKIRIGWIGTPVTVRYLNQILPVFESLSKVYLSMELVVIGAKISRKPKGVVVREVEWSESTEVDSIAKLDIGIMPLEDSKWERGKCGYKLIQYMSLGIPVVASRVGANKDIVENAVDGYLVDSLDEWENALKILLSSEKTRLNYGIRARNKIARNYSLQSTVPKLLGVLNASSKSKV